MQSQNIPSAASMPGVQGLSMTPDPTAAGYCAAATVVDGTPCKTAAFFGLFKVWGQCRAHVCIALSLTPYEVIGIGVMGNVVNGVIQLGLRALSDTGSSGTPYPSYTSTGGYTSPTCTGTRYISPMPTSDPCGIFIPTTTPTNPGIDLTPPGGGTTTVGPVTASLSVAPTSGKVPLAVTFTVTDTSTSCVHAAVSLSAGDGTNPVTALPATTACGAHTPVTFTYTYGAAGTYKATITNQDTQQVLQSVTITVTGGTTVPGVTNATLSVIPTSGTAPLQVTFTVTDISTACPRAGIVLSAGDGSAPVTALAVTNQCTGIPPAQFTYTYAKAGTYAATIMNQDTKQVLQSVTVMVAGGSTPPPGGGIVNAALSVAPNSGIAPLKTVFTITDISTACPRTGIVLSAGDGSNPVIALPVTNQCVGIAPAQFTYTYARAGAYTAAIFNQDTQQILQTVDVSVGAATTTAPDAGATLATLAVVPVSGTAPLRVQFTVTDISVSCPRSEITLSAGDGSAPVTALPATITCIGITPSVLNYTYQKAGTYTVAITNASTRQVIQTASVVVAPGSGETATPPLTVTPSVPVSSTLNVGSSLLNLTNSIGATAAPRTVKSGTWGEIQANASGVTITAGAHDTDGRTGVGGFYGYDTVPGVQPLDLAKHMCVARPWASSGATTLIPPTFFDSICTARGYKTSPAASAPAGGGAGTAAPKSSAPAPTVKTPPKTATSTAPAVPTVPPKVYIVAVPSSVKIGSRTSVFWNAVGVKSCLVKSPDGSFNGTTLYGAASTVPLTGETVFSIVCIKPDGSQISNFVKVRIAI